MLEFAFDNVQQLWEMAGHGPYVWACYGITAFAIVGLAITPSFTKSAFVKRQRVLIEREESET